MVQSTTETYQTKQKFHHSNRSFQSSLTRLIQSCSQALKVKVLTSTLEVYLITFSLRGSKLWSLWSRDPMIWIDSLWHFWHFQATDPLWATVICCQWGGKQEGCKSGTSPPENTNLSLSLSLALSLSFPEARPWHHRSVSQHRWHRKQCVL